MLAFESVSSVHADMSNAGLGWTDLMLAVALALALWLPTEMLFGNRK